MGSRNGESEGPGLRATIDDALRELRGGRNEGPSPGGAAHTEASAPAARAHTAGEPDDEPTKGGGGRGAGVAGRLLRWAKDHPATVGEAAAGVLIVGLLLEIHRRTPRMASLIHVDRPTVDALQQQGSRLTGALCLDNLLAVVVCLTILWFAWRWKGSRWRSVSRVVGVIRRVSAVLAALVYLGADLWENHLLGSGNAAEDTPSLDALHLATNLKWAMLVVAVLCTAQGSARTLPTGPGATPLQPTRFVQHPANTPTAPPGGVERLWSASRTRLGVSVSGGGIRSASFAMGALQALRERDVLDKARYVASVSGGSYATGAWAIANRANDGAVPYEPNGPEEQRLRRNLGYLVSDRSVALSAVGRVLAGLAVNIAVLFALTIVLVRPAGWLIGSPWLHPELRLTGPVVKRVAQQPSVCTAAPADPGNGCQPIKAMIELQTAATSAEPPEARFYTVSFGPEVPVVAKFWSSASATRTRPGTVRVRWAEPATVRVDADGATVVTQPAVELVPLPASVSGSSPLLERQSLAILPGLELASQPELKVRRSPGAEALRVEQLELATRPVVRAVPMMLQRGRLRIRVGHWAPGLALLGLAALISVVRITVRPRWWRGAVWSATVCAGVGLLLLAFTTLLPWLVDRYPRGIARSAASAATGKVDVPSLIPLPGAVVTYVLLAVSALRRFLAKRTAAPPRTQKANARALRTKVMRLVQNAVVGVLVVLLGVVTTLNVLTVGVANGPYGRLAWLSRELLGVTVPLPIDLFLWAGLVLLMLVAASRTDAGAWSLGPLYKRRLFHAFGSHAHDGDAGPVPLDAREQWEDLFVDDGLTNSVRAGYVVGDATEGGAELVLCCAANVVGENRAPTGRRAVSFTASRSFIGGPEVGWMPTIDYLARLPRSRRRDLSIPGFVALSGAAVSPAMGRHSRGPVGSLFAVLNVRLGGWLPHPRFVAAMDPTKCWEHNPGWPWFIREVARRFHPNAPYLYVTDGGHWENLGLVEVLRRGCRTVVCISAAGDGEQSLSTLGQAIELARADLGIEIDLRDALRTRPVLSKAPGPLGSGNELVVEHDGAPVAGRVAEQGFAVGVLRERGRLVGRILYIDAAMVDRLPLDVHAYAESHPEFPNISTGDQFFGSSDFDAYRVLGRSLVEQALDHPSTLAFRTDAATCQPTL